jgi:hypothetical protein
MTSSIRQWYYIAVSDIVSTLVFDIFCVVDAVSDRLTNTASPFCPILKASNVVVEIRSSHEHLRR